MILQAVPQTVRDELVASRRMTTFGVITYLLVAYSPGGVSEKQNILRSLEEPPEIPNVMEAPIALRRWLRWRNRAKEVGAVQRKGLLKMTIKLLESQRELQFRVSLVGSGLGVDTTPNDVNVGQFAYHLLAEFEQLALTEKRPGASSVAAKGEQPKLKPLEVERSKAKKGEEETGRSPTKREEGKEEKPKCRFFLTDQDTKVVKGEKLAPFLMMAKMIDFGAGTVAALTICLRHAPGQRVQMITLLRNHVCRRLRGRKSRHQVQEERKKKEAQNRLL